MRKWLGRKILGLLREVNRDENNMVRADPPAPTFGAMTGSNAVGHQEEQPETTFAVIKVANGKLVRVSEYKPTRGPGPDWKHEVHIVREEERVADVIVRLMAVKALEA